jgi:hypothetical protein
MKQKILILGLTVCLLLTGCSWVEGSYVSVTAHRAQRQNTQTDVITASDYLQLLGALQEMIASGTELAAVIVAEYPEASVEHGIQRAVQHAMLYDPLGSYAAEEILYELGTSNGVPAVSFNIRYRHNRSEIQRIRSVPDMLAAEAIVARALEDYDAGLVMLIETYEKLDFTQFVHDYVENNPETVMETPQVTENLYGTGRDRVVELIFTYQTSRDTLRRMQGQVQPVFDAASLYVSGDGEEYQKFSQLYAFLMERFPEYQVKTSITPAYSLLNHGVGDSAAFAEVYAEMCRRAGVECLVVVGTRSGEPWCWNIVQDGGYYYHVDLLDCQARGGFRCQTDDQMTDYVWDYSAYPGCTGRPAEAAQAETEGEKAPDGTVPPGEKIN